MLKENVHYCYPLERQILGTILMENTAFGRCFKILDAYVFRKDSHKKIYACMAEMWLNNLPIDLMSLCLYLVKKGFDFLDDVNTFYFITTLTNGVTGTSSLEYHCLLLRQMYIEREVLRITTSGINGEDGLAAVKNAEQELSKLRQKIIVDDFKGLDEVLVNLCRHMDSVQHKELSGITTGFKKLDQITGGLQPGGLYIIAARPSVGKSAFMGKMVLQAALAKNHVGIISLEMTDNQIAARLSSLTTEIDYWRIYRSRMVDQAQSNMFYEKINKMSSLPIVISDATGVNIGDIKAKIARLKAKAKIDILFVDYLQLLDGDGQKNGNREQEVSRISRGLKLLAKDYSIPVVVLAQLNRGSETSGTDKKPKLHNLRESGSLEQDADGVMFLHRDFMSGIKTNEKGGSTEGEADIIIAKWRDGEITEYKICFDGPKMKFFEFDELPMNFIPIAAANYYEPKEKDDAPF